MALIRLLPGERGIFVKDGDDEEERTNYTNAHNLRIRIENREKQKNYILIMRGQFSEPYEKF